MRSVALPLSSESPIFIILLGGVVAFQVLATTFALPVLPSIAQDFNTTPEIAQLTISGFMIGTACGQLLCGAMSDRFGRRPILLGGMALFIVTGAACAFAPSIAALVVLRVIQGVGGASGMILGRAIVRDSFERERALRAMLTISGIVSIVPMIGPPACGFLMTFMSWRMIYGALAVVTACTGLLAFLAITESIPALDRTATNPRRILANCRDLASRPTCIAYMLIVSLVYGGFWSFLVLVPFIGADSWGIDLDQSGWLIGSGGMAFMLGTHYNRRMSRRWPMRRTLRRASLLVVIAGLAMLAACVAEASWHFRTPIAIALIVAPMMVYGFNFGRISPTSVVLYLQPAPHIAGTASALGGTIQTFGGAAFALLGAALYNGTPVALGICVTVAGVAAYLIFTLVGAKYAPDRIEGLDAPASPPRGNAPCAKTPASR